MAANKAHIIIILLTFQALLNTVYGQQYESEILRQQENVSTDANYNLIKQLCNLLETVEPLRAAESSIHHQTVIEVGEALKSTMQTWFDGLSDTEPLGEDNGNKTDQLATLCVRATAAVKSTESIIS